MENNTVRGKKGSALWVIVAIIACVLIIWWIVGTKGVPTTSETNTPNPDALQVSEDTSPGSINTQTSGAAPASMTYQQAVAKYKNARLQINGSCEVAKPNNLTFKNNTNIMIDNRSAASHTVHIGSRYTIKKYGYKIINLSSSTLPITWLIDCDNRQNVGTILIQK